MLLDVFSEKQPSSMSESVFFSILDNFVRHKSVTVIIILLSINEYALFC